MVSLEAGSLNELNASGSGGTTNGFIVQHARRWAATCNKSIDDVVRQIVQLVHIVEFGWGTPFDLHWYQYKCFVVAYFSQ